MERNVKEVVIELSFKREVGLRDLGRQLYLSLVSDKLWKSVFNSRWE